MQTMAAAPPTSQGIRSSLSLYLSRNRAQGWVVAVIEQLLLQKWTHLSSFSAGSQAQAARYMAYSL